MSDDRQTPTAPLVSVYIPTRDRSALLQRAVSSVLAQTYPNLEIIISDDGSTDDTEASVTRWQRRHPNIVYLRSERVEGACVARNKAIQAASGEFVTGLDDDDAFTAERIATFVAHYREGCNFLCSLSRTIRRDHSSWSRYYLPRITLDGIVRRNCAGTQVFVRRGDLTRNDIRFDPSFPAWQDYDFITQLVLKLGPGTRVYRYSYLCYANHNQERVTDPFRIRAGYRRYRMKYGHLMTPSQRCSLAINASVLSGRKISSRLTRLCIRHGNLWDLMRIIRARPAPPTGLRSPADPGT